MSISPTPHEQLAAAVVTAVLKCSVRFIDTGVTGPIADYELELPSGEAFYLEVSRITDAKLRRLSASAAGMDWTLTRTRYSWSLGMRAQASVKKLHEECEALLATLERHDILIVPGEMLPADEEASQARRRLLDLGVLTAIAHDTDSDVQAVKVHPSWPWSSYDPGKEINSRVVIEARANADKFLRGHTAGHLFWWADDLVFSIVTSLSCEVSHRYIGPPSDLPPGVTIVWLAVDPFTTQVAGQPVWNSSECRTKSTKLVQHVWRVEPPKPWEFIGDVHVPTIQIY